MFKSKKIKIAALLILLVLIIVAIFSFSSGGTNPDSNPGPVVVVGPPTPAVTPIPQLRLVKTSPEAGKRETVDPYAMTFFEFSSELDPASVEIDVRPILGVTAKVYKDSPKVLVITPFPEPWSAGVEYTLTIKKMLGVDGQILPSYIEYKFSIDMQKGIVGGDPVM